MRKSRFYTLLLFLSLFCIKTHAQPKCYFQHYGSEDGLPQHTIMDILQDKKGFMWFSTWDGLCKFDGYDFTTHKILLGDTYHMKSNRIDHIYEDKYGNIWTLSYDKEAHRFNPKSEAFMSVKSLKGYENLNFVTSNIATMPSGRVWLLSEKNGAICVVDSAFHIKMYNTENGKIRGEKIYTIHEDKQSNTWILTNNGIVVFPSNNQKANYYFSEKDNIENSNTQSFYSIMEQENEIWFGSAIGRVWMYSKKSGQFDLIDLNCQSRITQIKEIYQDKILFVSANDGFFIYDPSRKEIKSYNTSNLSNMRTNQVISSYVDKSKNIWLEMNYFGVARFNLETEKMVHYTPTLESSISTVFPPNFFIFEDKENRVWVHPRGGGFSLYDPHKDALQPFFNEPGSPTWRFSNMLHSAFSDKQGNLWLGTRSYGLEKAVFDDNFFKSVIVENEIHSTVNNDVRSVFEDKDQNTWVSTKGGKVYIYDKNWVSKGYICEDGRVGSGTPLYGVAYCLMQDNQGNVWIGTKGEGIYKATPNNGGSNYQITHYKSNPNDVYSLSDNNIYSLFQDKKGRIWVGSYGGGLSLYDESGDRFISHRNNLKKYPIETGSQVRIISSDQKGNIYVGTTVGLIVFPSDFASPEKIDFKTYLRVPGENSSISGNDIFDICTTKDGITYIATFGGGLNKITETDSVGFPVTFKSYTTANGLPSDVLLTVVEDKNKMLWISAESNLTKFDPSHETFETFSEIKRLMRGQNFSEGSRYSKTSGEILVGYSKGLIQFNPDEVKNNTYNPYIAFVSFKLFNKDVEVGQNDSPLKYNIDDIEKLQLKHNQNFFSIEYSALDYTEPGNILYAYKLEGFDKDWIYSQNQRRANYTNLSKGEYIFKVKSTNSDGVWCDNERSLHIEITPSFWETTLAYFLYILLFVGFIYLCLRILFVYYRMKDKIELEHKQTEMKAKFFTDISHEIRTPLTMIVSPIENLLHDDNTPDNVKKQLSLVSKNTSRMLDMVNQILDFRKIQQKELEIQETEIGSFVSDICSGFEKTAEAQKINFIVTNNVGNEKLWIDRNMVEKIVFNLLSNAFKYTPEEKTIKVNIFNKNGGIAIQIEDEGVGISKDKQNRLFKRFESFNEDKTKPSTGIGLSVVKELADRHHAKITLESEQNQGTSVTVLFQRGKSHFDNDTGYKDVDVEEDEIIVPKETNKFFDEENELQIEEVENPGKPTVLIVEDDDDLREFIRTILDTEYIVYEAMDGEIGLQLAKQIIPDLIVSDIMMPNVDGMQFLQKIREDIRTSHILFILLTAKTTLDSKLDGMEYGADEYITKPFNVPFFRARVKNLLERRETLQRYYQKIIHTSPQEEPVFAPSRPDIGSKDEEFMKSVIKIIEDNMDNSDFMVEDLASKMGMSRTVFFKKIKSLTGLAPIEFIRDIVIQRAAQLLQTGQYSVKEVSYMVGISDSKYFSKCFKKKYNVTPSEYKKTFEDTKDSKNNNDEKND